MTRQSCLVIAALVLVTWAAVIALGAAGLAVIR